MRANVAYAVGEFRRIGRELVAGSWSKKARPLSAPQALAIMAEALAFVVDTGVGSVVERAKRMVSDLFDETVAELDFDTEGK